MATRVFRNLAVLAMGLSMLTAAAQYGYQPFFEQPLLQGRAYGLELVLQRLAVVQALEAPLGDDSAELVEEMLESDVHRFLGTLRATDADLAAALLGALSEVEELVEDGEDARAAAREARELTLRAYDLLVPPEVRRSPAFLGALIADLSLGDDGVAEAYEDAAEGELFEFTSGWAATQRVKELWGQMRVYATGQQRADVEEMLAQLDELYPRPQPPAAISGDPEEAEASVQRLLGILETVADAELFADRDLAALSRSSVSTLTPACAAYAAGNDEIGLEGAFAVGEMYVRYLAAFLGFMAPELHEQASQAVRALTGLEAEDDDDDGAGDGAAATEDDDGEPAPGVPATPAATCRQLLGALEQAAAILGD